MKLAVVALIAVPIALAATPQQTVFRSITDLVSIDASVIEGKRAITTLAREDFVLRDNGVEQQILDFGREQMPLDISFSIDISGSVNAAQRRTIEAAIAQVGATLHPDDRCRVLTFTNHIAQESPLRPPPLSVTLPTRPSGGTSILDALLLSLVAAPLPDRRQLHIMMTDGFDTTSFFDDAVVMDTMKFTTGQTTVVLVKGGAGADPQSMKLLSAVTATSGGQIIELGRGDELNKAFMVALEAFRTSYVLRYTPVGVPQTGWHTVTVTTKNPKQQVRARQGYWVR